MQCFELLDIVITRHSSVLLDFDVSKTTSVAWIRKKTLSNADKKIFMEDCESSYSVPFKDDLNSNDYELLKNLIVSSEDEVIL